MGIFPFAVRHMSKSLPLSVIPLLLSLVWFMSSFIYNLYVYKAALFKTYLSKIHAADIGIIVLSGLIFMFLKNVLYVDIVSNASPHMINIYISIMSLSSMVSLLYVLYIDGYRLSTMKLAGICFITVGVFMSLLGK